MSQDNFWFNVPRQKVDCDLLWRVGPQKVKSQRNLEARLGIFLGGLVEMEPFFHQLAPLGGEFRRFFFLIPKFGEIFLFDEHNLSILWLSQAALPRDCLMDAERLLHQLQASTIAWRLQAKSSKLCEG